MCGIAGLYNLDGGPVQEAQASAMCDLMRHRGPDDQGLWSCGPVAFAHRRLSIIDLSPRGRNPMSNEDGTLHIIYNGEIYNYLPLRRDLLALGHHFRSETDTEVIIHLYEEYGPTCVEMLNGMFAFAICDLRSEVGAHGPTVLLARDRFGVKPLYYTNIDGTFAFASEVKAFLALPGFRVSADPLALAEHFTFQNTFGERTLFKGVKLIPAGHYILCRDGRIESRQYWGHVLSARVRPDAGRLGCRLARAFQGRRAAAVDEAMSLSVPF